METTQVKFWKGDFGKEYTDRNTFPDVAAWDQRYVDKYGVSRLKMFEDFIGSLDREAKILEVGCNTGHQLLALQKLGFKNLYGVELQAYAVQKAKEISSGINIIQGSGFDIPFKDDFFDLVMVNGVLIHIDPNDLPNFLGEVHRCSKKWILGLEYYSEQVEAINYRGHEGYLWKADYQAIYLRQFSDLQSIKTEIYPYLTDNNQGNSDMMFLLNKK